MAGISTNSNRTVVILTPGFPEDETDSSCIPALQDYVLCLQKDFPQLKILVLTFQYPFKKGWYTWNGIDVFSAGGKNRKLFSRVKTWKIIWTQLKKNHQDVNIDVLHSFWLGEATLIAQRFAKKKNVKHIATIFGQDARTSNKYLRLLNFDRMMVVANSVFTAKTFFNTSNRQPDSVISFGLNMDLIPVDKVDQTKYDVIGVGGLTKVKNYDLFLEVIQSLVNDFPDMKVVIIGEGEERQLLEKNIRNYKLDKVVELKGLLPRKEVFQYLEQSKLFLHTAGYESSCHARLEALACGCSVVTFDNGYLPEHPLLYISKDKEEMISIARELLKKNKPESKTNLKSIGETVKSFHEIYFS